MLRVDSHATHGVHGQEVRHFPAGTDGGEQLDRLADVAQTPAAAWLVQHAVEGPGPARPCVR